MIFVGILFTSAIAISVIAAYFSIVGLMSIFSALPIAIGLMGVVLEVGKLVTASFLYRYWKDLNSLMKLYLTTSVIVLSIITSLGIFGFLSNAHSNNTGELINVSSRISTIEERIEQEKSRLKILQEQESKYTGPVRRFERQINQTQDKIAELTNELLPLKEQSNKFNSEIGAIRYITSLFYEKETKENIENSVRILIVMIVFVFDPLAILLVIAGNIHLKNMPKTKRRPSWTKDKSLKIDKDSILNLNKLKIF